MMNFKYIPWSGTKRKQLDTLLPYLKAWRGGGVFYDPFIGGGAVSWLMRQAHPLTKQIIGDSDPHLASLYRIQQKPTLPEWNPLWSDLHYLRGLTHKDVAQMSDEDRAARLIVCTRTAFGSRYETTKDGKIRSALRGTLPSVEQFQQYLQNIWRLKWLEHTDRVFEGDWKETVRDVRPGDLVFLDPPYTETLGYGNPNNWTIADQIDLMFWSLEQKERGVSILMTNHPTMMRTYLKFGFETLDISLPSRQESLIWTNLDPIKTSNQGSLPL